MTEPLDGIAGADALLGRPFPLPSATLPLARWVDVSPIGEGAEVVWSLDDSRPGAPGRLALYAGRAPAPPRAALDGAGERAARSAGIPGACVSTRWRTPSRRCAPFASSAGRPASWRCD